MARKSFYVCDKCGGMSEDRHFTDRYEIHTDFGRISMGIVEGTKTLELCHKCINDIIKFFQNEGEQNGSR